MGEEQPQHMPEAQENKGIDRFKGLFKISLLIIFVLLIVLVWNGVKVRNLEMAYAKGYNDCAVKCNENLYLLKSNCLQLDVALGGNTSDLMPIPQVNGGGGDNVSIQITTG